MEIDGNKTSLINVEHCSPYQQNITPFLLLILHEKIKKLKAKDTKIWKLENPCTPPTISMIYSSSLSEGLEIPAFWCPFHRELLKMSSCLQDFKRAIIRP